jgi:sugar lactone lactonase YvrE
MVAEAEPPLSCPSAACRRISTELGSPRGAALDSTGEWLYVIDESKDALFRVNARTGAREKDPIATEVGSDIKLADDRTAYTTAWGAGKLWRVDLETGRKTQVAAIAHAIALALDGKGRAYVATQTSSKVLYEVDLATGRTAEVFVADHGLSAVALDGAGSAYVVETNTQFLYRVSLATGRKTKIAEKVVPNFVLRTDAAGRIHYVNDDDGGALYRIDPSKPAPVAPEKLVTGLGKPYSLDFDPSGAALVADRGTGTLWRVTHVLPPSHSATVTSDGAGAKVVAGGFATPAVKLRNTGKTTIGTERVTVTAGPGTKISSTRIGWWANGASHTAECTRSTDKTTLTCDKVDLHLTPNEQATVWASVKVDTGLPVGTNLKATFAFGSPVFASGDSTYKVTTG